MNVANWTLLLFLSVAWILLAAASPPTLAMTMEDAWATFQQGDHRTSEAGFRLHAENGNPDAQYMLGWLFSGYPVRMRSADAAPPENPKEAARWFGMAAEQGQMGAQKALAEMYDTGYGVPEDKEEAFRWYYLAAEQGDVDGQYALADRYRWGLGVPEDRIEASRYYQLAADKDHPRANQDLMALHGLCPLQKHGSVSEAKRQLVDRLEEGICDAALDNDFYGIQTILKNFGKNYIDEEITVEEAYPYIDCEDVLLTSVDVDLDLLRVPIERPFEAQITGLHLIFHLQEESCDRELLGKIARCRKDIGHGCMDIFEHAKHNIQKHSHNASKVKNIGELLDIFKKNLRQVDGARRDAAFCRDFLDEPLHCQD